MRLAFLPARRIAAVCIALLLAACASPARKVADRIAELGLAQSTVRGIRFDHLVAQSTAASDCAVMRVYIEHDGTPWRMPDAVAPDPTPRAPLALELMGRDTGCRIYVGRPCYFDHHRDEGCEAGWWTHRRYSDEVVRSMAAVTNRLVAAQPQIREVVLIGYSGGGTIAWLMSTHVSSVTAVVTIAANLDVRAWTELHGFSPLDGSLDPALSGQLPGRIRQWHFVGSNDRNVPPGIVVAVATRQPLAHFVEVPGFDHTCCWVERWPELLREMGAPLSQH